MNAEPAAQAGGRIGRFLGRIFGAAEHDAGQAGRLAGPAEELAPWGQRRASRDAGFLNDLLFDPADLGPRPPRRSSYGAGTGGGGGLFGASDGSRSYRGDRYGGGGARGGGWDRGSRSRYDDWSPRTRYEPPKLRDVPPVTSAEQAITMLDELAPPSLVSTKRASEVPYGVPEGYEVHHYKIGEEVPFRDFDPEQQYLWTLDVDGTLHVAPETQPGFGANELVPDGRRLKHGDLTPSADGKDRGLARMGGKFKALRDRWDGIRRAEDGQAIWVMNNSSSYSGARAKLDERGYLVPTRRLDPEALIGVRELMQYGGTDVSHVRISDKFRGTIWTGSAEPLPEPTKPPPGWRPPPPPAPRGPDTRITPGFGRAPAPRRRVDGYSPKLVKDSNPVTTPARTPRGHEPIPAWVPPGKRTPDNWPPRRVPGASPATYSPPHPRVQDARARAARAAGQAEPESTTVRSLAAAGAVAGIAGAGAVATRLD